MEVWKCKFSQSGVLDGYECVDESTLAADDVSFPFKPDLEPGKYIWNGQTFLPTRKQHPFMPDGPDPWDAVYTALQDIRNHVLIPIGRDFSPSVLQFAKYYRTNIMRAPTVVSSGGS